MGMRGEFVCLACGYKARVSGGNDVGRGCATSTILCATCQELQDVVTTYEPWLAMEPGWTPGELHCPKSEEHRVVLWTYPGPCPKCGKPMEYGPGAPVLWD